jgi:uncharacterized protein (TIGR02246 family)
MQSSSELKQVTDHPEAMALVEATVLAQAEAWNRHDMTAFAAQFTTDADFVNVIGMWWVGREHIQERHAEVHRTIFRASTLRILETSVQFVSPAVALAHVNWEMSGHERLPGWELAPVRRGLMTQLLVPQGDRWLVRASHNTDIVSVSLK